MVFGKVIIQQFGLRDINYGIVLICLKDLGIRITIKQLLDNLVLDLNWKTFIGISNENLWWGPSIRNSIMMSNHAQGFKHITFNTINQLKLL